jgi:acylphosphatase
MRQLRFPAMPDDKTVRLKITGRVQGVGFRDWLTTKATEHGLKGWVRNRRDGSVEVLLSGTADLVDLFVYEAQRGPPSAQVRAIDEEPSTERPPGAFEIRPTA